MRGSVGNDLNSVNNQGFHVEETDSLRNQVPREFRKNAKHCKNGRKLSLTTILIFPVFATSQLLLVLQSVDGFHLRIGNEGTQQVPKEDLLTINSPSKSTTSQLYVVTPKSVREVNAPINYAISAIGINSILGGSVSDSNTSAPLPSNCNASGSIGYSSSSPLGGDGAWKYDAASSNTTASPIKKKIGADSTDDSAATLVKGDIFSWIRMQNGDDLMKGSTTRNVNSIIQNDIAIELDNSVYIRITNTVKDLTVMKPQDESRIKPRSRVVRQKERIEEIRHAAEENSKSSRISTGDSDAADYDIPSLSRAQHYSGCIERDIRNLAVSIASCIHSDVEWQHFCHQSIGGLEPLLECIRDSAESIRKRTKPSHLSSSDDDHLIRPVRSACNHGLTFREENLQMTSRACRVLRQLCGLSQEMSAIVTDGLLRANASYKNKREYTLMDDFCTILREADDFLDKKKHISEKLMRRRGGEIVPTMKTPWTKSDIWCEWKMGNFKGCREACLEHKLHVIQLLLAMTCASDSAVDAIRQNDGLKDVLLTHSSFARKERRRRWISYLGKKLKSALLAKQSISEKFSFNASAIHKVKKRGRQQYIEAVSLQNDLRRKIQETTNQVLAAIGYNEWVPKIPGQKGLRILCLDGGGSRGMTSVVVMKCLVDSLGGMEVADCFDLVVGTSTGAIIAFLVGLNRETSEQAVKRYDELIEKIFIKNAFSTPKLLFTTASYDESIFMDVLTGILGDNTMLDSRADPAAPLVFAVTSKMSSNPTHVALFRNYNYNGGEQPDPFVIHPDDARESLNLLLDDEAKIIRHSTYPPKIGIEQPAPGTITPENGSRHPGSFRILQKNALRASTAAPTVFKPVLMGGEMYCDGGIVASNPSAIAIHEARNIFPHVPIELVVSIGTGGFTEFKSEPRIGWDGIIGQIINSATDAEQIHHILEDILGDRTTVQGKLSASNTNYMRFNPTLGMPDEFPIDVTDPEKLQQIKAITCNYMKEPGQIEKLGILVDILKGRGSRRFRKWFRW